MRFGSPVFLWLIPVVVGLWWWRYRSIRPVSVKYPSLTGIFSLKDMKAQWFLNARVWLRLMVLVGMVLALARPQGVESVRDVSTQGIDMMLVLDASQSMMAPDLKPNRFEAAKSVMQSFVQKRRTDRIGLVIFGNEAFTQCPLTLDYPILYRFLDELAMGVAGDGTAIGMGMVVGLNRLKASTAKSKIMILLTDGMNNSGEVDPLTAADIAQKMGVKIYTVGVGREGNAPIPVQIPGKGVGYIQPDLDESTLKTIAFKTGGEYYRAQDEKKLDAIYHHIDALEKSEIKTKTFESVTEYFPVLLWIVLILIGMDVGILWVLRVFP